MYIWIYGTGLFTRARARMCVCEMIRYVKYCVRVSMYICDYHHHWILAWAAVIAPLSIVIRSSQAENALQPDTIRDSEKR